MALKCIKVGGSGETSAARCESRRGAAVLFRAGGLNVGLHALHAYLMWAYMLTGEDSSPHCVTLSK